MMKIDEKHPLFKHNPAVSKDGTINLKIGKIYKIFHRSGESYKFQSGQKIYLLAEITVDIPSKWGVPNLTQFTFLYDTKNVIYQLGSAVDAMNFHFEEITEDND